MTTFKESVRAELISSALPTKLCCMKAFLSALARITGSIEVSGKRLNLCLKLEGRELCLKAAKMFKTLYPVEVEISPEKGKEDRYVLALPTGFSKQALTDLELMRTNGDDFTAFIEGLPQDALSNACCKMAYLKGLYLGCGSVYVPEGGKDGYHFEVKIEDDELADGAMEIMSDLGFATRMSARGDYKLVYIKDSDEILRLIIDMGLADCALKLKSIMDERETSNLLNRTSICETANMDKVFTASSKHMLAIAKLRSEGVYDNLSPALRQTADIRSEYPEAPLAQLAEMLGVSKSCLSHRFEKLMRMAESI